MNEIDWHLNSVRVGEPKTHKNLTMYPLLKASQGFGFASLKEGLDQSYLTVQELRKDATSNELLLENRADFPVLILGGEELKGGYQDRVINVSSLIPPRTDMRVPVSCVEPERWSESYDAPKNGVTKIQPRFVAPGRILFSSARAGKVAKINVSMIPGGDRHGSATGLWAQLDAKYEQLGCSDRKSHGQLFRPHSSILEEFVQGLPPIEGQSGAIFLLQGQVNGLELFDSEKQFRKAAPQIIRSYAMDAIDSREVRFLNDASVSPQDLLEELKNVRPTRFPAIGAGEELRLTTPGFVGAALMLDATLVHLCALRAVEISRSRNEEPITDFKERSPQEYRRRKASQSIDDIIEGAVTGGSVLSTRTGISE